MSKSCCKPVLSIALLLMMILFSAAALAQAGGDGISESSTPSGFQGSSDWVVDDLMRPFEEASANISSSNSGGAANEIADKLGLDKDHAGSGIGGQFLAAIVGADTINRAMGLFPGDSVITAPPNGVFSAILVYGTYLGVLFTSIFLIVHAITAFFNKMEYGDVLGEAKERFIGGFRAVLAFALVMPMGASGIAGATYGVAMVAAASNGVGNKAAEVVVDGGFGAGSSGPMSFGFDHDYNPEKVSQVFSEGVAQDTCRQHFNTLNTNAAEVSRLCGGVISSGNGNIDVDYDSDAASEQSDIAYCEANIPSSGITTDSRYGVSTCQAIIKAQRDARRASKAIIKKYDGDLDNPEARKELAGVAKALHDGAKRSVKEINENTFDDYNGSGDNYMHGAMLDLVKNAGWPGMGLIYTEIGAKIDAVTGIQSSENGGPSFSMGDLENAGAAAKSASRIVGSNKATANAAAASAYEGGDSAGLVGGIANWISDAFSWVTDKIEGLGRGFMMWLFSSLFSDPAPVATHKIGSTVLGGAMAMAATHDFVQLFKSDKDKEGSGAVKKFFGKVSESTSIEKIKDVGDSSIIVAVMGFYISLLISLILLVSAFLVVILPKLPIFFVTFLALEWAIWSAILIFASPLWVALNLTAVGNQPGIFTQRALSGLGVLAYLFLFPTLVVVAVVISLISYNLVVPILAMLLLVSFGGGGVSSIIGVITMPFVVLLAIAVGGFVAIAAITKIPTMITSFLGIQAPGDSVTQQSGNFVSTPMQFNNVTPQGAMGGIGKAAGSKLRG